MKGHDKFIIAFKILLFALYLFFLFEFIHDKEGFDTDLGILVVIVVTIILAILYKLYKEKTAK
jgi:hypothetical protein